MQITTDLNSLFNTIGQTIIKNELKKDRVSQSKVEILCSLRPYVEIIARLNNIETDVPTLTLLRGYFEESALDYLFDKCANTYMFGLVFSKLSKLSNSSNLYSWSHVNGTINNVIRDEFKPTLEKLCMDFHGKILPLQDIISNSYNTCLLLDYRVVLHNEQEEIIWNPMIK